MSDAIYAALLGVATGAWALIVVYAIAEWVATWRKRRADAVRRFFVEAGNGALLAELTRLAPRPELLPFQQQLFDRIYDSVSGTFRRAVLTKRRGAA